VSYNVTDWQRAKKFYSETLGLPVAFYMGDEVGWMQFGEKMGLTWRSICGPAPTRSAAQWRATVVFAVDDAHATVAELRKRGVKCDDPLAVPDMVTYANFYDPEGNRLQIAGRRPRRNAVAWQVWRQRTCQPFQGG